MSKRCHLETRVEEMRYAGLSSRRYSLADCAVGSISLCFCCHFAVLLFFFAVLGCRTVIDADRDQKRLGADLLAGPLEAVGR